MSDDTLVAEIEALGSKLAEAKSSITRRFVGQERVVDLVLSAILCGGHGLLIGLPGLGKTRLVGTLSTVLGLDEARVQFTPDLMPADILGSEVLETGADGSRTFKFIEGPVFCQLLMADEINRASPRTQSALLQAMQEKSVTIAGQPHDLPKPFHVLATQNPIEQEGTYPLPEAQLDRFLVQIDVPYPDRDTERDILLATTGLTEEESHAVFTADELMAAQKVVRRMPVGEAIVETILEPRSAPAGRKIRPRRRFRAPETSAGGRDCARPSRSWLTGPRQGAAGRAGSVLRWKTYCDMAPPRSCRNPHGASPSRRAHLRMALADRHSRNVTDRTTRVEAACRMNQPARLPSEGVPRKTF